MNEASKVGGGEGEGLEREYFEGEAVHGVPRYFAPAEYAIHGPFIGVNVEYEGCTSEKGEEGCTIEDGKVV